jgi:hypothetical protein
MVCNEVAFFEETNGNSLISCDAKTVSDKGAAGIFIF